MRFITPLLIGVFFAASAIAQDGENFTSWIQDDFQQGLKPEWKQLSGTWTAEAGTVTVRGGAEHMAMVHPTLILPSKLFLVDVTVQSLGGGVVFNAEHANALTNSHVVKCIEGAVSIGYMDFNGSYVETRVIAQPELKMPVRLRIYSNPGRRTYSVVLDERNIAMEDMRFNSGFCGLYASSSGARFGAFTVSGEGIHDLPAYFVKSNRRQLDDLSYMAAKGDGLLIVNPRLNIVQRITSSGKGSYVSEIQVEDANAALRGTATDDAGKTYVIDAGNNSLRVFDSKDKVERVVSEGLDDPRDVTVANGKVYVLDKNGIVVFDQKTLAAAGKKAGGLFRDAKSISAFGDRLYVGDFGNGQVQVLLASDFSVDKVIKDNLVKPWGVTVEKKSGDIYVADPGAVAVLHYDKDGQFIERFDPITISGFISPRAVIMHGDMLYVADYDRILGFKKGVLTIRPTLKID